MKNKRDINVLTTYMTMLLDGEAFSNWKNKPDAVTRQRLVESLMKDDLKEMLSNKLIKRTDISEIIIDPKEYYKNNTVKSKMLSDMLIKEEEFLV